MQLLECKYHCHLRPCTYPCPFSFLLLCAHLFRSFSFIFCHYPRLCTVPCPSLFALSFNTHALARSHAHFSYTVHTLFLFFCYPRPCLFPDPFSAHALCIHYSLSLIAFSRTHNPFFIHALFLLFFLLAVTHVNTRSHALSLLFRYPHPGMFPFCAYLFFHFLFRCPRPGTISCPLSLFMHYGYFLSFAVHA